MKIGEPVKSVPAVGHEKHKELREAMAALKPGEWLTVVCSSAEEVNRLRHNDAICKPYRVKSRGLTLYLQNRTAVEMQS